MKICLIRCPSPFLIDERVFPPLGLMAVATSLKIAGHEVFIYDGAIENIPLDYEGYGFGPTTPEYAYALEAKAFIRKNNPGAKIVLGGPYATLVPDRCEQDGFDCIVVGDGEFAARQAFSNGASRVVAKELPLDEYPTIDRSVIDLSRYHYSLNGRHATTMITSQGCPFKCAFCSKNYHSVRLRNIRRVIEEIRTIRFDLGYAALAFPEDIFILNKERAEAICYNLRNWGIIWRCLVRADLVVKYGLKFLRMMKESGCVEVGMGVESGSDKILKIINKGETSETIKQAIRLLRESGIRVKGFFIVGLPGETYETLEETRAFLEEMKMDDIDVKIYQPYPGSPIWKNRDQYDIQWDEIEVANMFYKGRPKEYFGTVRTSALTTQQIYDSWVELEAKYKQC